jgi:hypothetical protein
MDTDASNGDGAGTPSFLHSRSSAKELDDGLQLPYDTSTEFDSDYPSFSIDSEESIKRGRDIALQAKKAIEECGIPASAGSDLGKLAITAAKLADFRPLSTHTIAVLGDAGEGSPLCGSVRLYIWLTVSGKSSLINSLLNCSEIAKTVYLLSSLHYSHH